MSALSFLFTIFCICRVPSQDGSAFILSNVPHDTTTNSTRNASAEAMYSTHSRCELNRTNDTLFFANTCVPNQGIIRRMQLKIALPYDCCHVNDIHSSLPECTSTDGNMRRAIDEGTAHDGPDVDPPKAPPYPSPESVSI
eukprot:68018_1